MSIDQHSGERLLWLAVVERHILDATWTGREVSDRGSVNQAAVWKIEADRWLRGNSKGYRLVCELAGIDGDFLREAYIAGRIDGAAFRSAEKLGAA